MFINYCKAAWRNLTGNKVYSAIHVAGLAAGMAVVILISLWIYDEVRFNTCFPGYKRIASVMQHQHINGQISSQTSLPYLMGDELRKNYGDNFKYVVMSSWTNDHILAAGDRKITQTGAYMEPQVTDMLSLTMLAGTRKALQDYHGILLSRSAALALFGNASAMNKTITVDNRRQVTVMGVYDDINRSSNFGNLYFIAPWQLYIDNNNWPEKVTNPWRSNSFQTFVQIADGADMNKVSAAIKDSKLHRVAPAQALYKPEVYLHPMEKWHLYNEFKEGVNTGGSIFFVWLFGCIGFFVLLLACINFVNLNTAQSERRAKEVGIRKAIGSGRAQLVKQFLTESFFIVLLGFGAALLLVQLLLPFYNGIVGKRMEVMWGSGLFWIISLLFCVVTGAIAGGYPAFYLSSFRPVKVLKGAFRAGRYAALPRRVLVVFQFAISAVLMIATVVVVKQIYYAKDRPVGYSYKGLVVLPVVTEAIHTHFAAVGTELQNSGAVVDVAEASGGTTYVDEFDSGFEWEGKTTVADGDFGVVYVSQRFGKTVNWQVKEGRDFSADFGTDSTGIIVNEAAVKFMDMQQPVGKTITWDGKPYHIIGVIKDMVMQSPYKPAYRTVFVMDKGAQNVVLARINPAVSMYAALQELEKVFKKYNTEQPFQYRLADEQYAYKFGEEERVGKLAGFFTVLALFICCLGLLGMASFMAEKRTKEVGVRKVLGASVWSIWTLLTRDFGVMVTVSLLIAIPAAYYLMRQWLLSYEYRTGLSWWIFAGAAAGALLLTLVTVSYQCVHAAMANPVKSLKTE